ncbi:MAG: hypothetical protein VYC39_12315 [Myxococcota bacterium]|nr:hypothetical protein [Myxococcota bacterium]
MNDLSDALSLEVTSDALSFIRLQSLDSSYVRMAKEDVRDRARVLESFYQERNYAQKLSSELILVPKIEESDNGPTSLRYQPGPHHNLAEILEQVSQGKYNWDTSSAFVVLQDIFRALERIHECPPERADGAVTHWGHGCFGLGKIVVVSNGSAKLLDVRFPATGLPETMNQKSLPFRAPEFNLTISKGTPMMDVFSVAAVALVVIAPKLYLNVSMQTDFCSLANSFEAESEFADLKLKPVLHCLPRALATTIQDRFDSLSAFRKAVEQRWSISPAEMELGRAGLRKFFGDEPRSRDSGDAFATPREIGNANGSALAAETPQPIIEKFSVPTEFRDNEEPVTDLVSPAELAILETKSQKKIPKQKLTPLRTDELQSPLMDVLEELPSDFVELNSARDLTGEIENAIESIDFTEDERPVEKPVRPPLAAYESSLDPATRPVNTDFRTDFPADIKQNMSRASNEISLELDDKKNVLEHNRLRDRELKIRGERQQKRREEFARQRFNRVATGVVVLLTTLFGAIYAYKSSPIARNAVEKIWSKTKSQLGLSERRANVWIETDEPHDPPKR